MTGQLGTILADIKIAHSIFALPFAVIGLLIGTRGQPPSPRLALLVLAAMVTARSAAMGFNRLVDRRYDHSNPRTRGRALPSGRVTPRAMTLFVVTCGALFVASAVALSPLCGALSPLVLGVLLAYSLCKRFTAWAHGVLGLALALAPPAAYLAARGQLDPDVGSVLWLALGVALWVTGFDLIYACQDHDHDRREGLHALPAQWGVGRSLIAARWLHGGMLVSLILALHGLGLGWPSGIGLLLMAMTLTVEHGLVAGERLDRVQAAFFTANGVVGLLFAAFVGAEILGRSNELWP